MYFYNCTNAEDVIYKGQRPEFMEYGPYTYREYDNYTDVTWENLSNEISSQEIPAAYMNFTQGINYSDAGDDYIDTKLVLTNQALYGVWYQQNLYSTPEN